MNQTAHDAIERAWTLAIKTRALCPHTDPSAVGLSGYISPPWYQARGAVYFVNLAEPLRSQDVDELNQIASFVNRSFVITMAGILEMTGVVPFGSNPDTSKQGGKHAQLTKCLRHRFAHGEWVYDASKPKHVATLKLIDELFPKVAAVTSGLEFIIPIDSILEPLKNGVLDYIKDTT